MSFIATLLALFKKTPATPVETPPEALDYYGFPTAETAELMRYLEQFNYAVGTATNGIKTAHVEVKLHLDSKNYHKNIDSRMATVRARIDNGMHKQPYVCSSLFPFFCSIELMTQSLQCSYDGVTLLRYVLDSICHGCSISA